MSLNNIELVSRALLSLGAQPIVSFEDNTAEAEITGALFPSIRDGLLSAHPWSFATRQRSLPQLVETPEADYNYAFALPNDFLRAISVGHSGRGRGLEFRITQDQLHTHHDQITLTYICRPLEASLPAFFEQALIMRLSAELCLPLTESTSRAEMLFRLAERQFENAKRIDSQQDTPVRLEDYSLINARHANTTTHEDI